MDKISQNIIDQILSRVSASEIIGEHTRLKRSGANYMGLCPFHGDKDPSFSVNEEKGVWYCFGCKKGGNIIGFLMEIERLSYHEAVEKLAKMAGIRIKEETPQQLQTRRELDDTFRALEFAALWYRAVLTKSRYGEPFREYVRRREVSEETAEEFMLGCGVPAWDSMIKEAGKRGFPQSALEQSGLIIIKEDGRVYDRFRNRLMFPIRDPRGRVAGFGARGLEADAVPKYLNSPQSAVFDKGKLLYGLNEAKKAVMETRQAVLVEGYMDVMAMHQFGFKNAIASMGTALTHDQVNLLKRYTDKVVLCFDSDAAGNEATIRSVEILLGEGMFVYVMTIPEGKDPDEFLHKAGAEAMSELLKKPLSYFDFHLERLTGQYGGRAPEALVRIARGMIPVINYSSDPLIRDAQFKNLSSRLGLDERQLRSAAGSAVTHRKREPEEQSRGGGATALYAQEPAVTNPVEELKLLRVILEHPEFLDRIMNMITDKDFRDTETGGLFAAIVGVYNKEGSEGVKNLASRPVDEPVGLLLSMVLSGDFMPPFKDDDELELITDSFAKKIIDEKLKIELEKLTKSQKEAELKGDNELRNQIQSEILKIQRKRIGK